MWTLVCVTPILSPSLLLSSGVECEIQQHRLKDHLSWRRSRHPHLRLPHVMDDVQYRLQVEGVFRAVYSNHAFEVVN